MRNIISIIIFISIACSLNAQNKHALVIGIGEYPAKSGWSKINGDNDIDIVCSFLADNGFAREEITTLKNAHATKANIIQQFKSITATAKPGAHVYIHFSGHGQQVTDTSGDEDVDSNGERWDEAWIPYDAIKTYAIGVYEGENHLIDDQINELLWDIRKRIGPTGKLTVVADACHSGGSSRGEEDEEEEIIVRGTPDRFIIPLGTSVRKSTALPIQWVMISACESYQSNYECKEGGKYYGSLSYTLYSMCGDILGRPLDVVSGIISKSVSNLSPRTQSVQVDAPGNFSNVIVFDGR